ncbi:cytochrome c biogenesis ATP-binding export protein CcmA [Brucella endophytica]|uniref:Cytochrome c biogenesis ATP-binding export protein CcmA n=1 Tax=Brucella endophytica TaxID=1963359 RepID=A0A916S8T1_9HYPH|nr:heme ABC exporter ATP-binding protein CcmA [Brucella endophytica]GGA88967.1 cytochrome c biogenesis ATP-binding export protein CcmA [Brucella endophytica]
MRLEALKLSAERSGETIFADLDFVIEAGSALVVTGPNGAGKSTLLRIIAGLLAPASGEVRLEGGEAFADVQSACHYLGHKNAMKDALSVRENLAFWQAFNGEARMDIDDALETVGLDGTDHLPFGYLSTGQKRRISIAKLLVSYRPVWLLDEPTAGLDKVSEGRFAGLMRGHLDAGGIIVAATHLPLGLEGAGELRMGGSQW